MQFGNPMQCDGVIDIVQIFMSHVRETFWLKQGWLHYYITKYYVT